MKNERNKILYNWHIQIFEVVIPKNEKENFEFLQNISLQIFIKNSIESQENINSKWKQNKTRRTFKI